MVANPVSEEAGGEHEVAEGQRRGVVEAAQPRRGQQRLAEHDGRGRHREQQPDGRGRESARGDRQRQGDRDLEVDDGEPRAEREQHEQPTVAPGPAPDLVARGGGAVRPGSRHRTRAAHTRQVDRVGHEQPAQVEARQQRREQAGAHAGRGQRGREQAEGHGAVLGRGRRRRRATGWAARRPRRPDPAAPRRPRPGSASATRRPAAARRPSPPGRHDRRPRAPAVGQPPAEEAGRDGRQPERRQQVARLVTAPRARPPASPSGTAG